MGTRPTLFQEPTVEIDLRRYEELCKRELQYEQYRKYIEAYDKDLADIIELDRPYQNKGAIEESEENEDE